MDRLLYRGAATSADAADANTAPSGSRPGARPGRPLGACLAIALGAALAGCTFIDQMMPGKKAARARAEQLHNLQLSVMRYADEYVGRTSESLSQLQKTSTPEQRLTSQDWKAAQATAAYTIASGPNAVGNALDMVVLASLSNLVLHDAWVGQTYGARAQPVQATYAALEPEAWQLVAGVLTESQVTRLREIIKEWRAAHPQVRAVSFIHFRDFAESMGTSSTADDSATGSLFSVLGIDPFSGLDPAVREIAQSRELAERAIYYMQRAPMLLDMQVERLAFEFAVMPETQALLADASRASLIGSASSDLVKGLPGILDRQREALVGEVVGTLREESATIGRISGDLRATLQAGTETATALQGTIAAVERLKAQFAASGPSSPSQPRGPPFDIRQYTEMLRQATEASRELNLLARNADALVPVLRTATQVATGSLDRAVDRLFLLALVLVLSTIAATLLAMLAYRRFAPRLARAPGAGPPLA